MSYEHQLHSKINSLNELFKAFYSDSIKITPSPVLYHYRNKIDPGFALKRYPEPPPADFIRETVLGFKERGRWYWPMEVEECLIAPEGVNLLFDEIRTWVHKSGLTAYDSRKGSGYLRNLIVRDGKRSGERMVVLITAPGELPSRGAFVEAVQKGYPAHSIYHGEFSGRAEVATAEKLTLLDGQSHITEALYVSDKALDSKNVTTVNFPKQYIENLSPEGERLSFRISPLSFFQTNPLGTERLYSIIRSWVKAASPERLYDLYGGAGGIAFSCADHAGEIISVENVTDATEDGIYNALENGVKNVKFITDTVRNFLKQLLDGEGTMEGSTVVLDPPRAGMHPKAVDRLLHLRPEHIIYVSCNPKILAKELVSFCESYEITQARAVDLFPHTPHVEALVEMHLRR